MTWLDISEGERLQKILEEHFAAKTLEYLEAVISKCKMDNFSNINYNLPTGEFVEILLYKLSNTYSVNGSFKRLNLVIFLERFKYKLPFDEQVFITNIITKCELRRQISEYEPRRDNYKDLLAKVRQEPVNALTISQREKNDNKIDTKIIVGFDLQHLVSTFNTCLGYEGAYVFAISSYSYQILNEYIIERILRELKNKTERPYRQPINIRLKPSDIVLGKKAIEDNLRNSKNYQKIVDLFAHEYCLDIVLVIWNYDIPKNDMEFFASEVWHSIKIEVEPFVKNKSRCFVVIFANLAFDSPMDGFTNLIIPSRFKTSDLIPWFRGRLTQLELEDYMINQYIRRLEIEQEDLMRTYHVIQEIVEELRVILIK